MLTLLAVSTREDPRLVIFCYSITVVSPGSQRNKPLTENQQLKQNSLVCLMVLAISNGFIKVLPTFISRYQLPCMQTIPVQIAWQSTPKLMFEPNTSLSTNSSLEKLSKTPCLFSFRLNLLTILPKHAPNSSQTCTSANSWFIGL